MAAFDYIALNERGREQKGVLEADSSRQVRQILRDRGLAPLTVTPTQGEAGRTKSWSNLFTPSLSVRDLSLVTRQLATLLGAGLPLEEAMLAVSKQNENPKIQSMLLAVRAKIMEGFSLANSLSEYPRAFPDLYRATVAAGESAGHLDLVLSRLADYTEAQQESRQRIQQAMVYPIILFVLTVAILAGLLAYVVPDVVKVFSDTGQELPALTKMIISLSEFTQSYGLIILVLLVVVVIGTRRLLQMPAVRMEWDRRLL
ncbi:MAG: type II secretion system F family protein, partial [Pseudomonadales bacterium]